MTNNNIPLPVKPEKEPQGAIEESFDFAGLILDYISHWKWFVFSLIICVGIAFFKIQTIVPTYRVGASIYLNDDNATKTSAVSMGGNESPMFDMKNVIDETEIEILKSRNSLMKVVDTLQLAYSYSRDGKWREYPMYKNTPVIVRMDSISLAELKSKLDLEISKTSDNGVKVIMKQGEDNTSEATLDKLPGTIDSPAGAIHVAANDVFFQNMDFTENVTIERPAIVAARMASNLKVNYAENASTIVNFEYTTPLTDLGIDVLKMIIHFYNKQIIEDKNRSAMQTEEFILARLKDIQNELIDVEERLRKYREQHKINDQNLQTSINFAEKSNSERQIQELMREESLINTLLAQVKDVEISPELMRINMISTYTDDSGIRNAIDEFNKAARVYNNTREDLPNDHEDVLTRITTLNEIRASIVKNLELLKNNVASRIKEATAIENRSQAQLAQQPNVDKGYQEIFRDLSVKEAIYIFLLQKREEIALQKTLATPTAQFIDDPSVIDQVAPKSAKLYFVFSIIGLVLPAVLIFAKRRLFPQFKEKEDIERITSIPIVGEICIADKNEGEIVINDNVSTSAAELFRLLRNNINFIRTENDKKVIMLTSAVSGEGKTFVAINLAMTYALANKKVVVVGFDIRRPVLAHKLGLSNRLGVTSYLSDQIDDISQIVFPTEANPNLYAVPAGPIPPNPNELMLNSRMEELFNQLRQEFDYIIVDTAPIGMVSDSFLILPYSDIQLFVSRATYSTRKGLHTLHDAINRGIFNKVYIVLNGVNMKRRTYQYRRYGSYYGSKHNTYGYGYGYGYGEKKRKNKRKKKSKTTPETETTE